MDFDWFTFIFMAWNLVFVCIGIWMVKLFIKQMKDGKSEAALPFLVVEATLVEKRCVRSAGSGKTRHYAIFEFEDGNRHEFRVLYVDYLALVEGYTGQLTIQGTSFKKFEKIE